MAFFLLGFSYLLISIRMLFKGAATRYPDYFAYITIALALAKLISAISGMFSRRKQKDSQISIMRDYSFVDACVSVVVSRAYSSVRLAVCPRCLSQWILYGHIIFRASNKRSCHAVDHQQGRAGGVQIAVGDPHSVRSSFRRDHMLARERSMSPSHFQVRPKTCMRRYSGRS